MLVHSLKCKNKIVIAKVNFLNQAESFVRKLHFSFHGKEDKKPRK